MLYTVNIYRGEQIESKHLVRVTNSVSSEGFGLYLRSSFKPFQLLPFVAHGGFDKLKLEERLLAIFSSSHSSEEIHIRTLREVLKNHEIDEENLYCNPHWPLNEDYSREMSTNGINPQKIHNNCSGKHTAMLLMCKYFGFTYENYWSIDHPLQRWLLDFLSNLFSSKLNNIGIDGCGAPIPYLNSKTIVDTANKLIIEDNDVAKSWTRIINSMKLNPYLVAGTGRFDSLLMERSSNKLVAKVGAEGVIFLHSKEDTLVIKSNDGTRRGADLIAAHYARERGLISSDLFEIEKDIIYNKQKQQVGYIEIYK